MATRELTPSQIKLLRYGIMAALFIIIALIIYVGISSILPGFFDVLEHGDQAETEAYIRSFGSVKGVMLALLLQFIQIISILFPGGPIQIAIGIIFGTFQGLIICHLAYIMANMLVFLAARRLGSGLERLLPTGERSKGKLSFISESEHPSFMVFMACLMPFMPNGLVPYVAAKTKITFVQFFAAVYFGSIPCLLVLCAIGSRLLKGDMLYVIVLCALLAAFVLVMFFARNWFFALSERIRVWFIKRYHEGQE